MTEANPNLLQNFKDLPEDQKIQIVKRQLEGIQFGELTIVLRHGKIFGFKYNGELKFFNSKPEEKKTEPGA